MENLVGKKVRIIEADNDEGGVWVVIREGFLKDCFDLRRDNHTICDIKKSRLLMEPSNKKAICKCGKEFITSEIDGGEYCIDCISKVPFN